MKRKHSINPALAKRSFAKKVYTAQDYIDGILAGNRTMLAQAITLVESELVADKRLAKEVIEACLPHIGNTIRLGITGTPGVGKSTFVDTFGKHLIENNHKVAVLAIDPSSSRSRGSVLGDKTRMSFLSNHPQAFIRPTAAGSSLGGVARRTREAMILCEAAGFDFIIVETVGVGQSEIAVHSMVDFFLLLLMPGAGDEVQGIKRGIMEMTDLIAINKSDGERVALAKKSRSALRMALHLFPKKESEWTPLVQTCSAMHNEGITDIYNTIRDFVTETQANDWWDKHRRLQSLFWLKDEIKNQLDLLFFENPDVKKQVPIIETAVLENKMSSFRGAEELIQLFLKNMPSK